MAAIALAATLWHPALAQDAGDPDRLLQEAERLAWLKAWIRAEPLYAEAQRLFAARGVRAPHHRDHSFHAIVITHSTAS